MKVKCTRPHCARAEVIRLVEAEVPRFASSDEYYLVMMDYSPAKHLPRGFEQIADLRADKQVLLAFNLEVANGHMYFVGPEGELVHNGERNRITLRRRTIATCSKTGVPRGVAGDREGRGFQPPAM